MFSEDIEIEICLSFTWSGLIFVPNLSRGFHTYEVPECCIFLPCLVFFLHFPVAFGKSVVFCYICIYFPLDTASKLNVHKTFRRLQERLRNVLCTFSCPPVSRGFVYLFVVSLALPKNQNISKYSLVFIISVDLYLSLKSMFE